MHTYTSSTLCSYPQHSILPLKGENEGTSFGGVWDPQRSFHFPNKLYSLMLTINLLIPAEAERRAWWGLKLLLPR